MPNSKSATAAKKFRGSGRVAFFKYKDDIRKAVVDEGYPVKTVYENLGGKMPISYQMFHRYVQRYVHLKTTKQDEKAPAPAKKTAPERRKTFTFDSNTDNSILKDLV